MKRKLSIFQYGSQFDPTGPTRYSPSDWIDISVSESSPSEGSCSIGPPPVSNSSASEASTGIRDELTYYSPMDLRMTDMSEEFQNACVFFKGKIEYIGADLPSTWTLEGFTQLVLGEEEVFDPSYLSDVYSNLLECGFHSCYWEEAFEYIQLINAFPRYRYDQLMGLGRKVFLPLSLARVVPVSGVLVTFQWLCEEFPS
ncbi:hypothetical protein V6N13_014887 [Hibiscus sabdariffa]|uniref:Uncharacterized protein n=1 Tax=Hibiscus sabdariffa TaxID=183260 RepID=A0ABR1ZYI3_9ROSI